MGSAGGFATLIAVVVVALPVLVFALAARRAFHGIAPLVFRCRRCNGEFLRKPYRKFPAACPLCHAHNWNR
jgi:Zn finger protein HypA/HybF involved in hydrogenase expression